MLYVITNQMLEKKNCSISDYARNHQNMGKTSAVELPWTHNTPVIYDAGPRYHAP